MDRNIYNSSYKKLVLKFPMVETINWVEVIAKETLAYKSHLKKLCVNISVIWVILYGPV